MRYYCLAMSPQGDDNQKTIGKGCGDTENEAINAAGSSAAGREYFDVIFCSRAEYMAGRFLPPPAELEEIRKMLPLGSVYMFGSVLVWERGGFHPTLGFRIEGAGDHRQLRAGFVGAIIHRGPDGEEWRQLRGLILDTAEELNSFIREATLQVARMG